MFQNTPLLLYVYSLRCIYYFSSIVWKLKIRRGKHAQNLPFVFKVEKSEYVIWELERRYYLKYISNEKDYK